MRNPESQKSMGKMALAREQFSLLANKEIYLSTLIRNLIAIAVGVQPIEERVSPKNPFVKADLDDGPKHNFMATPSIWEIL